MRAVDFIPKPGLTFPMRLILAVIVAGLCCVTARAEDWTVDGKDYHNVVVGQVEADRVHISYDGGVGTVALVDLSPELQKRFNYDPQKAKASADARAQVSAEAQQEIATELAAKLASQNAAHKSPKPEQVAAIQAKIDRLELDIRQCQQKQATLTQQELLGSGWQYGEEIRQDKVAIKALQTQLQ